MSRSRVLRDVPIKSRPVEIEVRDDFVQSETGLESFQDDPQVQAILEAAHRKAEKIIAEAKKEGEEMLLQAQAQRDAYVEAARQEGREAGYQEGFEQGSREADILKEQAQSLLAEARKAYRAVMVQAEPNLLELSLMIAEKVIRSQVELAEDTIIMVAKELLKEVHAGETFYLYVNPSEVKLLEEARQELLDAAPPGIALHFVADKSITSGGCRLETDTGYYDATIEGQLSELKKLLQDGGTHGKSG